MRNSVNSFFPILTFSGSSVARSVYVLKVNFFNLGRIAALTLKL